MGIKVLSDKQKKYHKLKSKHSKAVKNIVKRKAKLFTNNSTSLLLKGESSCKDDFNGTKQSSINKYLNGNTLIQKEDKSPSIRNKINRITKKLKIITDEEINDKSQVHQLTCKTTKNFRPKFK